VHEDRTVVGYHGCDAQVAARLLEGAPFVPSTNDYDWLGHGIYFWEYGPDRAARFALEQQRRGKVQVPAVVGVVVRLGTCFDLLDTRFTADLAQAYARWAALLRAQHRPLPSNTGRDPDRKLRRRDCAALNWYLAAAAATGTVYDTVRCAFVEGVPVFEGSAIHHETHLQVAVRNPRCIVRVFDPTIEAP
jgi:hypothetical protein